jgi:hypothetical protein
MNQLWDRDPSFAQRVESEIADAAAAASSTEGSLRARVLAWGWGPVSIQLEMPGWIKVLSVPDPVKPGDVKQSVVSALGLRFPRTPSAA